MVNEAERYFKPITVVQGNLWDLDTYIHTKLVYIHMVIVKKKTLIVRKKIHPSTTSPPPPIMCPCVTSVCWRVSGFDRFHCISSPAITEAMRILIGWYLNGTPFSPPCFFGVNSVLMQLILTNTDAGLDASHRNSTEFNLCGSVFTSFTPFDSGISEVNKNISLFLPSQFTLNVNIKLFQPHLLV